MTDNIAGTASDGAIWSQVEISVGIISACLPTYRPLITYRGQQIAKQSQPTYRIERLSKQKRSKPRHIRLDDYTLQQNSLKGSERLIFDKFHGTAIITKPKDTV